MPDDSYTASLFQKGENTIMKKLGEEFAEMIVEFSREGKQRMISETTDLLYHLLVMLSLKDISLDDLYEEIKKRAK
ncbi:phosphoribosyl-ATP diphosphatase [Candidatus Dojkabacteria bacterium]|nr:phosphoribosyl-ATP diphosphatase [Candidatus Dojkabacteria bacterium]